MRTPKTEPEITRQIYNEHLKQYYGMAYEKLSEQDLANIRSTDFYSFKRMEIRKEEWAEQFLENNNWIARIVKFLNRKTK